jgi:FAD/FMN-containing dehydrogenase
MKISRKARHPTGIIRRLLKNLRRLVLLAVLAFLVLLWRTPSISLEPLSLPTPIVNDITGMTPIGVAREIAPTAQDELIRAIRDSRGAISIGGGRFSMGGQTASTGSLHIDMRRFNQVLNIDQKNRTVTVQAGATWRQLQEALDPLDLSVKIMQSYANFTIGGSLSVNVHGRYIGEGPLIRSVRSLRLLLADGSVHDVSPVHEPELFFGAVGGYGGLGVILDATLEVVPNSKIKRTVEVLPTSQYLPYFRERVRDDRSVIFQNADLIPPSYDTAYSVEWRTSDAELTEPANLAPIGPSRSLADTVVGTIALDLPFGSHLRPYLEPLRYWSDAVVWRNYEASYDVADLAPISTPKWSFVLQEYFVPVARIDEFIPKIRDILAAHGVDVANISIRHALPDTGSYLAWAREEVFAFVLYYRQCTDSPARHEVATWTRELIDAATGVGGAYYLPYQLHATKEQLLKAYPRTPDLVEVKHRVDPEYRFRNTFWDSYYEPSMDRKIYEQTTMRDEYARSEAQTFLTLPEWNLVFASDELASVTATKPQSEFRFFGSILDFWTTEAVATKATWRYYPFNFGYHFMNVVIGVNTTIEYLAKGIYENTVGRLTAWWADEGAAPLPDSVEAFTHKTFTDYGTFIHHKPWFVYPFTARLKELWSVARGQRSIIRHYERKLSYGVELALKAALAKIFSAGTEAIYGSENERIESIVQVGGDSIEHALPEARVISPISGDTALVSLPRYERLTSAISQLVTSSESSVSIIELAGNRRIAVTVTAPPGWTPPAGPYVKLFEMRSSIPGRIRLGLALKTSDVVQSLRRFRNEGVALEHVYDY